MMKALLLTNSDIISIPSALRLQHEQRLAGIVIPDKHGASLESAFSSNGIEKEKVYIVSNKELASSVADIFKASGASVVIVITFPWRLPRSVHENITCINLHPGKLPAYRGSDPIFWQIRNSASDVTLTAHIVTSELDAGPVLKEQIIDITPSDSYGAVASKVAYAAAELIFKMMDEMAQGQIAHKAQEVAPGTSYYGKPEIEHLSINWGIQTATEIRALVNACNPRYNGAIAFINGKQLNILEVALANVNNAPPENQPGQVVYADELYGPVVACINNQYLRINTACTNEGFASGSKLYQSGMTQGHCFH